MCKRDQSTKTCFKNLFPRPALMAAVSFTLAGRMTAQTFTTLYSFGSADGGDSHGGLIISGHILYGTTANYGRLDHGTVFGVNTDGAGFTILHNFAGSDGANPSATLLLADNTLFGTAYYGGSSGWGTLFKLNTDGTGFTTLHSFTRPNLSGNYANSDGVYPNAGLILSGNILYGAASGGGSSGKGTVFKLNTDG